MIFFVILFSNKYTTQKKLIFSQRSDPNPSPTHVSKALPLIYTQYYTVCPGSSDPPEKILNIFASENEVYTIF